MSERDLLTMLRYELNYLDQIAQQGAEEQVSTPFRDNDICPNHGDPLLRHACHQCLLFPFVPESAHCQDVPCHFIVVSPAGETLKALMDRGDRRHMVSTMRDWLRRTIAQLEVQQQQAPGA